MYRCVIALLLSAAMYMPAWAHDDNQTIYVVSDDYCPLVCSDLKGQRGYAVDIVTAVFERLGFEVSYQSHPWLRAVDSVERGHSHMIIGASPKITPGLLLSEQSIGGYQVEAITLKDDGWSFSNVQSLAGRNLGVVDGYFYGEEITTYLRDHQLASLQTISLDDPNKNLLRMLLAGRVDTVLLDGQTMEYQAKNAAVEQSALKRAGQVSQIQIMYLGFMQGSAMGQELKDAFDDGVSQLRSSGELKSILERYGLNDWQ